MNNAIEVCSTADGSNTVYAARFDACYHSTHGAVQESAHVFVQEGLEKSSKKAIRILELGFGTGLNAILTYEKAHPEKHIDYHAIEAYPLEMEVVECLNFTTFMSPHLSEVFFKLHKAPWGNCSTMNSFFTLTKQKSKFEEYEYPKEYFDLIYHDAFAPTTQPLFWERPFLKLLYASLHSGGSLVTYCAKGSFKRALRQIGFIVENPPGPAGKREMTRALKG